ncbi:MAG: hypothetical protein K8R21_01555 [Leptospira sp.]|nr:hypothetical protein [Leptospira sp.]
MNNFKAFLTIWINPYNTYLKIANQKPFIFSCLLLFSSGLLQSLYNFSKKDKEDMMVHGANEVFGRLFRYFLTSFIIILYIKMLNRLFKCKDIELKTIFIIFCLSTIPYSGHIPLLLLDFMQNTYSQNILISATIIIISMYYEIIILVIMSIYSFGIFTKIFSKVQNISIFKSIAIEISALILSLITMSCFSYLFT